MEGVRERRRRRGEIWMFVKIVILKGILQQGRKKKTKKKNKTAMLIHCIK